MDDMTHSTRASGVAVQQAERHPGLRADARLHACLPHADRPDPARRRSSGARRRSAGRSSSRSPPTARTLNALQISFGASLHRGARQCRLRPRSSPGCWCATAFPAAASSTPSSTCPSRCRPRSPASRSPRSTRRTAGSASLLAPLGIKIAYTPLGIVIALIFIGLPFVVRTVQPVLEEFDQEVEEAAATLGANRCQTITRVHPAGAGAGDPHRLRARLRARRRRIRLGHLHRRQPAQRLRDRAAADRHQARGVRLCRRATAIAAIMLVISFVMLLVINLIQAWSRRRFGDG